jgi:hypothetical protein
MQGEMSDVESQLRPIDEVLPQVRLRRSGFDYSIFNMSWDDNITKQLARKGQAQ